MAILLIIVTLALILSPSAAQQFIGYDCGSRFLNITTLSLLEVGECEIPADNVKVNQVYMQLLQINEFTETPVIQCKVSIHRTVYHCGMWSHVSVVNNGESEYIREVAPSDCEEMHRTGNWYLSVNHKIEGLRINDTKRQSVTFAGTLANDGSCSGVTFSDPYGTWDGVVVSGVMEITLTQYTARVSLNSNKVHLKSGTTCNLNEGSCVDYEGGQTFWRPLPHDQCGFDKYGVLYEGYANKMTDLVFNQTQTVYSLSSQDVTFALTAKGHENVCGYSLVRTEHPKLIILETTKGGSFAASTRLSINNLDIFAYVNSKFIYVEKHVRAQMKNLYHDALLQRCKLERQTLKNSLSIAAHSPDEFAYHLMKGPGYMAVVAGEVVHIVKCVPVDIAIQHGDDCYAELQVTRKNTTYYMSPRTHILKNKGTQIACNALIPAHYLVGDTWVRIMPKPIDAKDPSIIKPMTKPTCKYINPEKLATNGIHSERDIRDL